TTGVSSVTLEVGPPGFPIMFPELSDQERRSAMVYVSHADETERNARIQRVRHTIDDSAKTPPVILTKISHDLDKGKGHVFSYPDISSRLQWPTSKKLQSTSSAPLVSLESEGEAESSSASLPVVLPPFDVTTGFQLGTSSMDPTTGNIKGGKKARRRPPSWKQKTQGRVAGTASNSAQKGDSYKENGTKRKMVGKAGFEDAVRRGWDGGTGDNSSIMDRLSGCRTELSSARPPMYRQDSLVDLTLKVSDLFIPNTDLWDKEKVRDTFTPEDAERVLKIKPLLSRPDSDVWGFTKHMAWDHRSGLSGAGWLVRDHLGIAINHSRRAYVGSMSKREADLKSLHWAVESMVNMRLNNVILEASSIELRESLLEPHRFPELQSLIATTLLLLSRLVSWSLLHVQESRNRVSNAIAVSVTADLRTQSYVATGGPSWLSHTILSEAQAM
ncbi:hypothetical protein IGI04_016206, partial [Brassica rapa subsp. trilocularis]